MNEIIIDKQILQETHKKNNSTDLITTLNISNDLIEQRFNYYYSIPQPPQKSQAWLDQRTNYITASAFGNALAPKGNSNRNELLKNKVSNGKHNSFTGNEATRWGEKYEDVCCEIYCYRNNVTVKDFGLIPHPKYPFIGASTDGITSKLINLEIKSPFSRTIIPGKVKPEYWKQMQLQMDVLDLPLTHFLECSFEEYPSERDFWIDFDYDGLPYPEKGIIIEIVNTSINNNDGEPKTMYIYSPISLCKNANELKLWYKQNLLKIISSTNQIYIETHFWILKMISCVNVKRDKEWFDEQIPIFVDFWHEVEHYRNNGGLEKLNADLEILEKLKPKSNKIKVESPSSRNSSHKLLIDDDIDNLKPSISHILSSSDEDIESNVISTTYNTCLIDSSDDENTNKKITKKSEKSEKSVVISINKSSTKNKTFTCLIDSDDDHDLSNANDKKINNNIKVTSEKKKTTKNYTKLTTYLIESSDDELPMIKKNTIRSDNDNNDNNDNNDDNIENNEYEFNDELGKIKYQKKIENSIENVRLISHEITNPIKSPKAILNLHKKLDFDNTSNSSSNCSAFDIDTNDDLDDIDDTLKIETQPIKNKKEKKKNKTANTEKNKEKNKESKTEKNKDYKKLKENKKKHEQIYKEEYKKMKENSSSSSKEFNDREDRKFTRDPNDSNDEYSSGSDTEHDSPPMRPPSQELKTHYKKKRSSSGSVYSPKKY